MTRILLSKATTTQLLAISGPSRLLKGRLILLLEHTVGQLVVRTCMSIRLPTVPLSPTMTLLMTARCLLILRVVPIRIRGVSPPRDILYMAATTIHPDGAGLHKRPEGVSYTNKYIPTLVAATHPTQTHTVTLLGRDITITLTAASYTWSWGMEPRT